MPILPPRRGDVITWPTEDGWPIGTVTKVVSGTPTRARELSGGKTLDLGADYAYEPARYFDPAQLHLEYPGPFPAKADAARWLLARVVPPLDRP